MKTNLVFERFFQVILFVIAILGGTVLSQIQIVLELLVIILMSISIRRKLTIIELAIIICFIFISAISFFQNALLVFILNLKVFLIPLLLLIFYKDKIVDTLVVKVFFILNIFLILFQIIFNRFIFDISGIISVSFQDEIENRPLGVFLNFHFSAFFTAICLINYLNFYSLSYKIASSLLVAISGSFFTLFSFVLSLINKYILIFGSIVFVVFYLTFSLNDYLFNFSKSGSLIVILFQIFDWERYSVLSFFPQDYSLVNSNWHNVLDYNAYLNNRVLLENEIQYITYLIQGGYFFAAIFLIYYLKSIPTFAIFILIAMLHYGYALNPLIVFLTIVYQNKINLESKLLYAKN